jgi:hypothetical protein
MSIRIIQFLALILTALAFMPGSAHFFALPNKIALDAERYFIVQDIYRGWALFGIALFGALLANCLMAFLLRGTGWPSWFAALAAAMIALNLAIFFVWTYPANVATENWTQIPANWAELRTQWEYSHAVNALVMFAAFCFAALSALTARE